MNCVSEFVLLFVSQAVDNLLARSAGLTVGEIVDLWDVSITLQEAAHLAEMADWPTV